MKPFAHSIWAIAIFLTLSQNLNAQELLAKSGQLKDVNSGSPTLADAMNRHYAMMTEMFEMNAKDKNMPDILSGDDLRITAAELRMQFDYVQANMPYRFREISIDYEGAKRKINEFETRPSSLEASFSAIRAAYALSNAAIVAHLENENTLQMLFKRLVDHNSSLIVMTDIFLVGCHLSLMKYGSSGKITSK